MLEAAAATGKATAADNIKAQAAQDLLTGSANIPTGHNATMRCSDQQAGAGPMSGVTNLLLFLQDLSLLHLLLQLNARLAAVSLAFSFCSCSCP